MTRRIVLELAWDTTETECGSCTRRDTVRDYLGEIFSRCIEYGEVIDDQRPSECIHAEKEAARMVAIDPEDAAALQCPAHMMGPRFFKADRRISDALREHGRKAR